MRQNAMENILSQHSAERIAHVIFAAYAGDVLVFQHCNSFQPTTQTIIIEK